MKRTKGGLLVPEGLPEWRGLEDEYPVERQPLLITRDKKRVVSFYPIQGASRQYFIEPMVPIMVADQTPTSATTSEQALWPVSPWSAFVANQFQPGQIYRFTCSGVMSTASSTPGTVTFTPRWGTTTAGTTLGPSNASATLTASAANVPWRIEFEMICRGSGASAPTYINGEFGCDQAGVSRLMFGGPTTNIDTSTPQGLWMGVTLSNSANSLTTKMILIEIVN